MPRLQLAILLYMHLGLVGFGSTYLRIGNEQTESKAVNVSEIEASVHLEAGA
jgi:hypothetical protein